VNVLDLFMGTGSATQPFRDCPKGHRVVGVDLVGPAEIRCDVRKLPRWVRDYPWDFVWASPPCERFSTASAGRGLNPAEGMVLVREAIALLPEDGYWCLENVRGAVRHISPELGEPILRKHAYYLWGNVPLAMLPSSNRLGKGDPIPDKPKPGTAGHPRPYTHHFKPRRTEDMARIPFPLAEAVHRALCPEAP